MVLPQRDSIQRSVSWNGKPSFRASAVPTQVFPLPRYPMRKMEGRLSSRKASFELWLRIRRLIGAGLPQRDLDVLFFPAALDVESDRIACKQGLKHRAEVIEALNGLVVELEDDVFRL